MLSPQNQVDRRDFLKLSGAGLAAALMSSKAVKELPLIVHIQATLCVFLLGQAGLQLRCRTKQP